MRIEWGSIFIKVIKEEGDKRPKDESNFFYHLRQAINSTTNGTSWIKTHTNNSYTKPKQAVPGLNSIPYALRQGKVKKGDNTNCTYIYDGNYQIRDTAKDYWRNGNIVLDVWNATEDNHL